MTEGELICLRLNNQHLSRQKFENPKEVLHRMGALQAQDYEMVKWAMGVRLPGSTKGTIEKAIENGEIIRTHVLRPTWHFVAAGDLRWMLELTAPKIRTALRTRHKFLGLTDELVEKSNKVIIQALESTGPLARKELVQHLEDVGFENKDNIASHLLLCAELDGLICSGPTKDKAYTYALLEERAPKIETPGRDEALARLARTYFRSHGPATLQDFIWWSGLRITDARRALKMIEPDFLPEEINAQTYWFSESFSVSGTAESAYLLPAYDEFIISYKNRDMMIPDDEKRKKAISNNGIFRPIIVVNGQVVGIWKRSLGKETVSVETDFFNKPTGNTKNLVEEAAEKFAAFLGRTLTYSSDHSK